LCAAGVFGLHIYLSPHHDDVCFSLAHCASRQGGSVVNLFTRSQHVATTLALPSEPEKRTDAISAIRRQEDMAFVGAAGLERHDLKLEEPSLLGLEPFDLANLDDAAARTSAALIPFLLDLLPASGARRSVHLYCPMGIGGHRDHLSTLISVRDAYDRLSPRCSIHLYEDLHYASVRRAREVGLRRAFEIFDRARESSSVHLLGAQDSVAKLRLIALYASQHANGPQASQFVPASGLSLGFHEIVWHV
jgi:hypothetical protein